MAEPTASATPAATPSAAPKAATPADPKAQVKSVVESVKTGQPVSEASYDVVIDGKPAKKTSKELIEAYQLRELSDKKRSEADKTLAEANKFFQAFKADPIKAMKAMGMDFDSMSTQYLSKKAEEAMMDPKERELQAAKKEAELYKKYVEEQKAAQEKAAKEQEVSGARQQIHKEIVEAIQEASDTLGLPVDEELVIHVAQRMMLQDMKQKPLSAKEALPKAYESQQKYLKSIAAKMEGEQLVKWLGDDVAKKIRRYDLQQLKAKRTVPAPQARVEAKPEAAKAAKPYKTWSEFKRESLDTLK